MNVLGAAFLKTFIHGGVALASWACALFFLRFWRDSRDRLFAFFSLAFFVLGCNWVALALLRTDDETRHYLFLVRLLAFLIILYAVWDKNRSPRAGDRAR